MHLSARVTRSPRERRGERPVREGEREMRAERTRKGEGGRERRGMQHRNIGATESARPA